MDSERIMAVLGASVVIASLGSCGPKLRNCAIVRWKGETEMDDEMER